MRVRTGVIVAAALAASAFGRNAAAIVGGTPDTTRPEVLLMQDETLAGFRCTATLVAPNLVITARHCVGKRGTGTTLCKGNATEDGAQALPNYVGDAEASPMTFAAGPGAPILARGKAIHDDGSTTTCGHDLALIELDRSLTIPPATLRRTAPLTGEPLVAMGFGWTDRNATINATERMKGSTRVLALGPTVYSFQPNGNASAAPEPVAVAAGEIAVQGVTMTGDSGGPSFDETGALTALVARGYNDALYGPGTFTLVASHLATIDAALAASGNAAPADAGTDAREPSPPAADAAPPRDPAPGQAAPAEPAQDPSGGSCSVAVPAREPAPLGAALVCALGIVAWIRRGAARRSSSMNGVRRVPRATKP